MNTTETPFELLMEKAGNGKLTDTYLSELEKMLQQVPALIPNIKQFVTGTHDACERLLKNDQLDAQRRSIIGTMKSTAEKILGIIEALEKKPA